MSASAIPTAMQVAMLHDVDDLRIEMRDVPALQPGDLLVRIVASGICSGDLMPWYIRRKAPLVLGHEPAGEIVAIGDGKPAIDRDGQPFAVGQRVAVHHHAPCLVCRFCERGDFVQCATWKRTRIDPGGIAQYVRVPHENLVDTVALPAGVSYENAVLVEPLGCVVKSLRRARLRKHDVVYVIGLGVMGLLHVVLARRLGYAVYASDFQDARRAKALELGASGVFFPESAATSIRDVSEERGADVVICGPGTPIALQHAIDVCAPGGTVVMFTPLEPGQSFNFDQSAAYFKDLTLVASYSCGPDDTREALAHLADGEITLEALGAVRYSLDATARAYAEMSAGEVIKSVITF